MTGHLLAALAVATLGAGCATVGAPRSTTRPRCSATSTGTRTGGSLSAKSSTPIGHREPSAPTRETAGSNTAKGSTPIGSTTMPDLNASRTAGPLSPKGSTPAPCTP